ncbi:MAG: response regulator [Planctomycetota bacterium]
MPKVLLVDDSTMIRMILKGLLTQLKVSTIVEAANGKEALELLRSNPIDLVLLDLHMPVLDGHGFLQVMRESELYAALPVVVISSDTDPAQLDLVKKWNVAAFVQKPFRLEGLQQALIQAGVL